MISGCDVNCSVKLFTPLDHPQFVASKILLQPKKKGGHAVGLLVKALRYQHECRGVTAIFLIYVLTFSIKQSPS